MIVHLPVFVKNVLLRIERIWAMPNKWTFTIKPIKKLLDEEMNNGVWIDPYAGMNSPATITNDINPDSNAQNHLDATEFLINQKHDSVDGVLYDPPYSVYQGHMTYNHKIVNKIKATADKNLISNIIRPNGKVICFGWNSNGMGKSRGFELLRLLLVPHGAAHNDTIVTVERKINGVLF